MDYGLNTDERFRMIDDCVYDMYEVYHAEFKNM